MSKHHALVEILSNKPVLTRKDLAIRYGRHLSSIDRWHAEGVLPPARYLRGCPLPFWRACDLEAAEKTETCMRRAAALTKGTKTNGKKK